MGFVRPSYPIYGTTALAAGHVVPQLMVLMTCIKMKFHIKSNEFYEKRETNGVKTLFSAMEGNLGLGKLFLEI